MLEKFKNHLDSNFKFLKNKKLLLATSGGLDSMVMVYLLHQLHYDIGIAHCNFQLRGVESFEDQNFVNDYALQNQIPIFVIQFDTTAYAANFKLSTQMAARELRYDWFYELLDTENYDYILTAHHADDNLETFLINLTRGTGLDGLVGIPEQNNQIIRTLLIFSRDEILEFANQNNIQWREDSSNASDKYLRNKLRHQVVPILKQLSPNFLDSFQNTQSYLQDSNGLVNDALNMMYQQIATESNDEIHFDIDQLLQVDNYKSYLYHWLKDFGFSAWDDIYNLTHSQTGKQIFSDQFKLLKNRQFLILSPINNQDLDEVFFIQKDEVALTSPLNITFCKVDDISKTKNTSIFVDADKLNYPLELRHWKEGDFFYPLGMNGKSKKVSKLFKDEKLSLIQKQNTWVLCSDNEIVWIVGIRQDERFKVNSSTQNTIQISIL